MLGLLLLLLIELLLLILLLLLLLYNLGKEGRGVRGAAAAAEIDRDRDIHNIITLHSHSCLSAPLPLKKSCRQVIFTCEEL